MSQTIDLTLEAPRSAKTRIRGYAIIARTIDKARAFVGGNIGTYHFDCPLDNMLFSFKNIKGDDFKKCIEAGDSDEEIALWVDQAGSPKTEVEIEEWSDSVASYKPFFDPEKRDWFVGECEPLGLNPETTTLFDYLDADDFASYKK